MTSNSPIGASNILFLGAGASHSLGKMLMGEFIEHLKSKPEIAQYALFGDVVKKNPDLEFLMEELASIGRMDFLDYGFSTRSTPPPPVSGWPIRGERSFRELSVVASKLTKLVRREIFLHYRETFDTFALHQLYQPLLHKMTNGTNSPVVIFTTNYDLAVENFCRFSNGEYQVVDGFEHDANGDRYVWSREVFGQLRTSGARNVVLFKLHGSTNWMDDGPDMLRLPVSSFADGDDWHSNLMIYPATRKIATDDPYFTCYWYLEECLSRANHCLAIGYSFRDYDVLTRIKGAVLRNPKLVLEVLDPCADSILQTLNRHDIKCTPRAGEFTADNPLNWLNTAGGN
jgi:SIR2-like domain